MSIHSPGLRRGLYLLLGLIFLAHNDFWQWTDARLVAGLPVGLAYHVGYCVHMTVVMAVMVTWAWPNTDPDVSESDDSPSEHSS